MIWEDCVLLNETYSEKDSLGNPIKTLSPVKTVKVRATAIDNTFAKTETNNGFLTSSKYDLMVAVKKCDYVHCTHVNIGNIYEVVERLVHSGRYVLLFVRKYK